MDERLLGCHHSGVYRLEGLDISSKGSINPAHLPTLLLIVGYPMYWVELYSGSARDGIASGWAAGIFIVCAIFVLLRVREQLKTVIVRVWTKFRTKVDARTGLAAIGVLSVVLLGVVFLASTYPIHLQQEGDALNYHYSLTRQHLILQSFALIPWSGFDLFLMPVDYALAPFWFVTVFPNKFAQFLFLLGLLGVGWRLCAYLKGRMPTAGIVVVGCLLGSHGHGIQFASAMLDLVNVYLLVAMLDSFFHRNRGLFVVEAVFYFWSKPFIPLQTVLLVLVLCVLVVGFKRLGFKEFYLDFQHRLDEKFFSESMLFLKRCGWGFVCLSLVVAGPFVVKSIYYVGTPIFPWGIELFPASIPTDSQHWASIHSFADYCLKAARNGYGVGRSLLDGINHLWLIAVPSEGVNNAFDYPLGLTYLLVVGPFIVYLIGSLRKRRIVLIPWLIALYWVIWFMGSQQSRWLFIPVFLMFVMVAVAQPRPSGIFLGMIIAALLLNGLSLSRAHGRDLVRSRFEVLRTKDKALIAINHDCRQHMNCPARSWDDPEVAYAQFPVVIRKDDVPYTLAY